MRLIALIALFTAVVAVPMTGHHEIPETRVTGCKRLGSLQARPANHQPLVSPARAYMHLQETRVQLVFGMYVVENGFTLDAQDQRA